MRTSLALLVLIVLVGLALLAFASDRAGSPVVAMQGVGDGAGGEAAHELAEPELAAAAAPRSIAEVEGRAGARSTPLQVQDVQWPEGFARVDLVVVDRAEPVEGASLVLSEEVAPLFAGELDESGVARTDARGRASFYVRPLRTVEVTAAAMGSMWATTRLFTSPFEGRARKVTIELTVWDDDGTFEVLVRSLPSEEPIEGAEVVIRSPSGLEIATSDTFTTGPNGVVSVPWRDGLQYHVSAERHTSRRIVRSDPSDSSPVLAELEKHARLQGSIVVAEGARRARIVRLLAPPPWSNEQKRRAAEELGVVRRPAVQVLHASPVGEDGTWSIEGVAFAAGTDRLEGLRVDVDTGDATRALAVDLVLRPGDDLLIHDEWSAGEPLTIRGIYPSGVSVGARVPFHLIRGGSNGARIAASAQTESDGRARFPSVPIGAWSYAFRSVDPRNVRIDGTFDHSGTGEVDIIVPDFDAIAGRVVGATDRSGTRLSTGGLRVAWREAGDDSWRGETTVSTNGAFKVDFVPLGESVEIAVFRLSRSLSNGEWGPGIVDLPDDPIGSIVTVSGDTDVVIDLGGK